MKFITDLIKHEHSMFYIQLYLLGQQTFQLVDKLVSFNDVLLLILYVDTIIINDWSIGNKGD